MKKLTHLIFCVVTLLGLLPNQSTFAADKFTRQDIQIKSGGLNIAGWQYVPTGLTQGEKRPAIVMAHGWSAVKEMYLDDYAAKFANNGFVVTVFDYAGVKEFIADIFDRPVDVIDRDALKPHLRTPAARDALYAF